MSGNSREKETKTIKSVTKAFDLIEYMALAEEELGVTEIAEGMNYGVSGMYHLLNTLKESNIIEQNIVTKKFKLSLKLWQIGMLAYDKNDISTTLKPYLIKVKELTGETTNLTILEHDEIVYIAQEQSNRLLKMFTEMGASAPLHCTGAGKILLAFQSKKRQKQILNSIELEKYTHKTIINEEELLKEMKKIRNQGYSLDDEEREIGVSCIAAPIFDINNKILASISISGPESRFTRENQQEWIKTLVEVGKEATDYIGNIE